MSLIDRIAKSSGTTVLIPGSTKPASIYALKDPRDGAIRYVGYSVNPVNRLRGHIKNARLPGRGTHKACWIRSLISAGVEPQLHILEADAENPQEAEIQWIARLLAEGCDLTNSTSGGDGVMNLPAESMARMSLAMKRWWKTPGIRERWSRRAKIQMANPASVRKLIDASRTPEILLVRSARAKIRCADPEWRKKMKDIAQDPVNRKKASEASKRRWAVPGSREQQSRKLSRAKSDPDVRRKISDTVNARYVGSEGDRIRAIQSDSSKKRWADPEYRKRTAESIRLGLSRPEVRATISAGVRAALERKRSRACP